MSCSGIRPPADRQRSLGIALGMSVQRPTSWHRAHAAVVPVQRAVARGGSGASWAWRSDARRSRLGDDRLS